MGSTSTAASPATSGQLDRFEHNTGERREPATNPALRGMDELEWKRDEPEDRERLLVKYQNYKAGEAEKKLIG